MSVDCEQPKCEHMLSPPSPADYRWWGRHRQVTQFYNLCNISAIVQTRSMSLAENKGDVKQTNLSRVDKRAKKTQSTPSPRLIPLQLFNKSTASMRSEMETGSSQTKTILAGVSRTLTTREVVSLGRLQHNRGDHVKVGVHHLYLLHPTWENKRLANARMTRQASFLSTARSYGASTRSGRQEGETATMIIMKKSEIGTQW